MSGVTVQSGFGVQPGTCDSKFEDSVLLAERHVAKQAHLLALVRPQYLIADVKELASDSASNLTQGGEIQLLPFCFFMDGGFPCTSRSPLSSSRAANVNCVQEGREATGEGFRMLWDAIRKHNPQIVNLECVSQLQQTSDGLPSDSDWILQQFRAQGYWAHAEVISAEEFGGPGPRTRLYWTAMRGLDGDEQEIKHFFNQVLMSCKEHGQVDPIDRKFITACRETRKQEASAMLQPLFSQYGKFRETSTTKQNLLWKVEHKLLFEANGLKWPLALDSAMSERLDETIMFCGLLPREAEAMYFLHRCWPMREILDAEYIDINLALPRHVRPHLDEDLDGPCLDNAFEELRFPIGANQEHGVSVLFRLRLCLLPHNKSNHDISTET